MRSMSTNKVWDLEEISKGAKRVGCRWVYKIKYDSKGNIEKYKKQLVAKGYTQRERINYNETFSPVSCKDSFKIVMALVAHYCRAYSPGTHTRKDEDGLLVEFPCNPIRTRSM
jgi:hypothetical protein